MRDIVRVWIAFVAVAASLFATNTSGQGRAPAPDCSVFRQIAFADGQVACLDKSPVGKLRAGPGGTLLDAADRRAIWSLAMPTGQCAAVHGIASAYGTPAMTDVAMNETRRVTQEALSQCRAAAGGAAQACECAEVMNSGKSSLTRAQFESLASVQALPGATHPGTPESPDKVAEAKAPSAQVTPAADPPRPASRAADPATTTAAQRAPAAQVPSLPASRSLTQAEMAAQLAQLQNQVAELSKKVQAGAPKVAVPKLQYASLAVHRGQKGRYGKANNWDSPQEAEQAALKQCNEAFLNHRGGCETIVTFGGNGCGSYRAIDPNLGTAWGAAAASGLPSSQDVAAREGRKYSKGIPLEYNLAYVCNWKAGGDLTIVYQSGAGGGEVFEQAKLKKETPAQVAAAAKEAERVAAAAREAEQAAAAAREAEQVAAREREAATARQAQDKARRDAEQAARDAAAASAASARGGRFTNGAGYYITVQYRGNTMVILEPNGKESVYSKSGPGYYEFVNPTNGIAYCMREIDSTTLEACKPNIAGGTRLTQVRSETGVAAATAMRNDLVKLGQSYLARAQSDPANAQTWSFCGVAAMARAQGNNDEQVRQAATALKTIMTTNTNPCPQAIPPGVWAAAG